MGTQPREKHYMACCIELINLFNIKALQAVYLPGREQSFSVTEYGQVVIVNGHSTDRQSISLFYFS